MLFNLKLETYQKKEKHEKIYLNTSKTYQIYLKYLANNNMVIIMYS